MKRLTGRAPDGTAYLYNFFCQYAEVIGNIYDGQELLEVTPDD